MFPQGYLLASQRKVDEKRWHPRQGPNILLLWYLHLDNGNTNQDTGRSPVCLHTWGSMSCCSSNTASGWTLLPLILAALASFLAELLNPFLTPTATTMPRPNRTATQGREIAQRFLSPA